MGNVITVGNAEMQIREYNGQRVVTFKDIDEVHQRKPGTTRNNFYKHKSHFVLGEDYYIVTKENSNVVKGDFNVASSHIGEISPKGLTLITETGYLMLVKSFRDDLSWEVQRKLVTSYFNARQTPPQIESRAENAPSCPETTDWYTINKNRLNDIALYAKKSEKEFTTAFFNMIGSVYDIERAIVIYCKETDKYPSKYDLLNYFPNLMAEADRRLQLIEDEIEDRKRR